SFKIIRKPESNRIGVADYKRRNTDRYTRPFGESHDLNGQITQIMKGFDVVGGHSILAQGIVYTTLILSNNFCLGQGEESFIPLLDQVFSDKVLETKEYYAIHSCDPTGSRSEV